MENRVQAVAFRNQVGGFLLIAVLILLALTPGIDPIMAWPSGDSTPIVLVILEILFLPIGLSLWTWKKMRHVVVRPDGLERDGAHFFHRDMIENWGITEEKGLHILYGIQPIILTGKIESEEQLFVFTKHFNQAIRRVWFRQN